MSRQGTAARIATAQRKITYSGVGMETDVKVSDRPVTQQGMMGMRVRTAGPGRQVQDNTYYLGLLRNKITEITTEINKFKREISQFHADNSQYAQLERKYEAYIKEVRQLEGQLADYNLAMDKTRTGSDPADLAQYQARLKEKNEYEKREVDNIFMHRKQKDELVQKCESEIISLQQQAEEKISQLAPEKVQEYRQLVQQTQMGQQNAARLRSELDAVNQQVRSAEHELNRDQLRDEYHRLVNQVDRLERERSTLEEEMRTSNMDPEQVRQLLLTKVKEDNAKIAQLESSIKTVNDEMGRMRRSIGDHEDQLEVRFFFILFQFILFIIFYLFFFSCRISFFPCILLLLLLDCPCRTLAAWCPDFFFLVVVIVVIYSNENQTRVHIKSMKFYFNEIKR
jgi:intraflagellar transport protein 74